MDDEANNKMKEIQTYVSKLKLDVFGISECNIAWKNMPIHNRLAERTRGWWEAMHVNTAYFETYPSRSKSQAGGVSLWSINKGAHRVLDCGKDPSGLGRWAWTRYRGRQGVTLRIVVGYRPVLNSTGPMSVWNQQKGFLEEKDDDRCPRSAFVDDLCGEVAIWMEQGDQVIIGMDLNEDVRQCVFSGKLWLWD